MRVKPNKNIVQDFSCERNYLSDISPKDKPWDNHKSTNDKVSSLYREVDENKRSLRISKCSQILEFALKRNENLESKLKLNNVRFCRVRTCPVCQWRRSLTWRARLHKALPKIFEGRPNYKLLFLTLTVKNCKVTELKNEIDKLNKAWLKMTKRKRFPGIGWIKSVEVTRPNDEEAHPHLHCIIMVSNNYFKSVQYINKNEWIKLWQKSLKVDYEPSINIQKVKLKGNARLRVKKRLGRNPNQVEEMSYALVEIFKYSIKESDLTASAKWLKEVTNQLHNTRAISLSGIFREHMSEKEPEDLLHLENEDVEEIKEEALFLFGWDYDEKRYRSM